MSISTGQISKVKSMAPRIKQSTAIALPITPISAVPILVVEDDAVDDPSKSPQEGRNAPRLVFFSFLF